MAAGSNQYAAGYQDALADVLAALDAGGEDAARVWIADNTTR